MSKGQENLVSFGERTTDEQRKIAKAGGVASGKARRRKRTLQEAAQLILNAPANQKHTEIMKACGIPENACTNGMAIATTAVMKAADGDLKAAEFIRDTVGENPKYKIYEKKLEYLIAEHENRNSLVDEWVSAIPDWTEE